MCSTQILYSTHYGSSKTYAQWLGEELDAPVHEASAAPKALLASTQTLVFVGGIYAGSVKGLEKQIQTCRNCQITNWIVVGVGISQLHQTAENALLEKYSSKISASSLLFFHLPGRLDYSSLKPVHRFLLAGMKKMLEKQPTEQRDETMQELLNTYGRKTDLVSFDAVKAVIDSVKALGLSGAPR